MEVNRRCLAMAQTRDCCTRGVGGRELRAHLPPVRVKLLRDERREFESRISPLSTSLMSTVTVLSARRTNGLGANGGLRLLPR